MPRRPPPSSLRLVPGPLPARSVLKHSMPSVPRPTLLAPASSSRGPSPCLRQIPSTEGLPRVDTQGFAGSQSPVMNGGSPVLALAPTQRTSTPKIQRGPWDHSGTIPLPFDVESMITPLKPVALR
ncbi:hypothetical protein P691DRAFT_696150 [Macrolepiota fuliginosa MF-IS2]|uniref:Uncharacterized protein n=1 Tax=Macrolepiota fuliginosa MF-IS2 TaxID=1400762 RepID=A0A9P5XNA0_9AGAR|nr:hypothetical protein P691DRAFT_696150 [Macrolepiota fuliginosa MF-IS2]